MEYECGPLLLYSQDKIRMMDFLSDVFEFDVDCVQDTVHKGTLYFKLLNLEADDNVLVGNNSGVVFSFKVKSEQELKEIMSKYNFFLYRKSNSHHILENIEFLEIDSKKILTISDIDQRRWRFEFEPRADA